MSNFPPVAAYSDCFHPESLQARISHSEERFHPESLHSKVANGALAGCEAPDFVEAYLDEYTTEEARAQRRPRLRWDTSRRKDGREMRSGQVILGQSLLFRCSSMSSALLSCGFRLHLHEDIQSDGLARK